MTQAKSAQVTETEFAFECSLRETDAIKRSLSSKHEAAQEKPDEKLGGVSGTCGVSGTFNKGEMIEEGKREKKGNESSRRNQPHNLVELLLSVAGIYASFLVQGVVQESVYSVRDVKTGAKFKCPVFLVSTVCLFSAAFALTMLVRANDHHRVLTTVKHALKDLTERAIFRSKISSKNPLKASTSTDLPSVASTAVSSAAASPTAPNTSITASSSAGSISSTTTSTSATSPTNASPTPSAAKAVVVGAGEESGQSSGALAWESLRVSVTYVTAMCCTNFALTRVNYPTQVLVKSAKAVPVIVGGFLLYGKRYPLSDYLLVATLTTSLILFQYSSFREAGKKVSDVSPGASGSAAPLSSRSDMALGLVALLASLTFDGITGPSQDRLIARHNLNGNEIMFLLNLFAAPAGFIFSALLEGSRPYETVASQPLKFLPLIFAFVLCGTLGQFFIVRILRQLGSLHLTLITTTRKFLAILVSVIIFGHAITPLQWAATAAIFSAGFLKYFVAKSK